MQARLFIICHKRPTYYYFSQSFYFLTCQLFTRRENTPFVILNNNKLLNWKKKEIQ